MFLMRNVMKKWSGDGRHYLPARQVEPYRLWFEFLKLAATDPDLAINYTHYEEWGDFQNLSFNEWWSGERWRKLFAIDAGVRVIEEGEDFQNDPNAIYVRLPLSKDPKETIKDVMELLEQHGASARLKDTPSGKFALTEGYEKGFIKYLLQARVMLRLYRIWLSHAELQNKGRLGQTAVDFVDWSRKRSQLITQNDYKFEHPYIPYSVGVFADDFREERRVREDDKHLKSFQRFLKKARNLAANAASGNFPGKW
jgi:hypothetical protein